MKSRSFGRRAALRAGVLAAVTSAGCIGSVVRSQSLDPPPFGPPGTDWPMTGRDAANTAASPNADGPVDAVSVEWEIRPSQDDSPGIALAGDLFVVTGDDSAVAFDLGTGERRWSVDIDGSGPVALDEQRCYVRTASDRLQAYGRGDGSDAWTVVTSGTVQPPVVSNGLVLVGDGDGQVHAIDAATGDVDWSVSVGDGVRGRVATDGDLVAVSATDAIVVLDATDGDEQWRASLPCCSPAPPVLADGVVYTLRHQLRAWDVADGDRRWAYDPGTNDTVAPGLGDEAAYLGQTGLDAVDRTSGERRWQANGDLRSLSTRPVHAAEIVYVGLGYRVESVAAVDPADGTVRWTESIGAVPTSLAVVGDRLLATTADGRVLALRASD